MKKAKEILEKHYTGKEYAQCIIDAMIEYSEWCCEQQKIICSEYVNSFGDKESIKDAKTFKEDGNETT